MPRRPTDQLERNRAETAKLYFQGWLQVDIAKKQGIDQSVVSDDLAAIRKQWLASSVRDFDEARAQELAKIDILEVEFWRAWQRSCEPRETDAAKSITKPAKSRDGTPIHIRDESAIKKEYRDGDPRFLAGVERCIERRCKLLGLDALERKDAETRADISKTLTNALKAAYGDKYHNDD